MLRSEVRANDLPYPTAEKVSDTPIADAFEKRAGETQNDDIEALWNLIHDFEDALRHAEKRHLDASKNAHMHYELAVKWRRKALEVPSERVHIDTATTVSSGDATKAMIAGKATEMLGNSTSVVSPSPVPSTLPSGVARDGQFDKDYLSLVKTLRDPISTGRAMPLDMAADAIEELLREVAARTLELAALRKVNAALSAPSAREDIVKWLDNNITFYDVAPYGPTEGPNVPTLTAVSKRIWYHATDDQRSYPFSEVVKQSMSQYVGEKK